MEGKRKGKRGCCGYSVTTKGHERRASASDEVFIADRARIWPRRAGCDDAAFGEEGITIANRKWRADKFELKVPFNAPFLMGTSPSGLLLDFAEEDKNGRPEEQGMKLVSYQQWLDY